MTQKQADEHTLKYNTNKKNQPAHPANVMQPTVTEH
jgi:hypothetical protein